MKNDTPICEQVQMAAMAHLDGEQAIPTPVDVETHLAGCADCRAAVAALAALQSPLNRLGDDAPDTVRIDVWPGVRQAIAAASRARSERRTLFALAIVLALWRLAQLSVELPAPVVNSVVPLALMVLVLRRVAGDPFAIRSTSRQLQEEGV